LVKPLRSFAELALATGRFEMELTARQGDMHESSLIGLDLAAELGLFEAKSIVLCGPASRSKRSRRTIATLGELAGDDWILRCPASAAEIEAWDRLLAGDEILVFEASNASWAAHVASSLHSPHVAVFPGMGLTEQWLEYERRAFVAADNQLHVTLDSGRSSMTFVGVGPLFEVAIDHASLRPPLMHGYSNAGFRETAKSRELIFPDRHN
jgi:hypothetical protein